MKNFIFTLTILCALAFTGIKGSYGQGYVHVFWHDVPQDCNCPLPGNAYWQVWCAIYDECYQPYETVFEDTQVVGASADYYDFQLDDFCNPPTSACFFVVASIDKLCPDGQGGYVKTCCGKFTGTWETCQHLMTNGYKVDAEIQWCP